MKTIWNRITKTFSRPAAARNAPASPPTPDQAKKLLDDVADRALVAQQIAFAQSLLVAVGENPESAESQALVHQMALEQLRMRAALTARPRLRNGDAPAVSSDR